MFSELASLLFSLVSLSPEELTLLTVLKYHLYTDDSQFCISSLDLSFELHTCVHPIVDPKVDLSMLILHRHLSQTYHDPKAFLSSCHYFSKYITKAQIRNKKPDSTAYPIHL